jgi:CHAT domain-containing protein
LEGAIPDSEQDRDVEVSTSETPNLNNAHEKIEEFRHVGLENVKKANEIHTAKELESSWSGGVQGIDERQNVARYHSSFWTVHLAIHLLLVPSKDPSDETVQRLWSWVQRYKARSLSRPIGTRETDPPGLMEQIRKSTPKCREMYEDMLRLQEDWKQAVLEDRLDIRRRLDVHRHEMKKHHSLLRRLIDLTDGTSLEQSDIASLEADIGFPVVLVDWFYLQPMFPSEPGKLLLFTARSKVLDKKPSLTMDILSTTMEKIEAWRLKNLNSKRNLVLSEVRSEFDRSLGGLIALLAHRTDKNEVLVLCPSASLHRLPLHALRLPNRSEVGVSVLIQRNPIVYSHSHSLLRSCVSSTESAQSSPTPVNPRFISGIFEEESESKDVNENEGNYAAGRKNIKELAEWFGTPAMRDADGSKKDFMVAVEKSRVLHLHTHCNWISEDPLNHHLEFPAVDPALIATAPQNYQLTAREVFDMHLLSGTHVNMIACQGVVTDVKPGDEVLRLVPALLYSGASSTVSTLWSIHDEHGAEFSSYFFQSFLEQCLDCKEESDEANGQQNLCFADIARALQDTVKAMLDEEPDAPLYRWASFVMHGFWQFPLSRDDIEWLATDAHERMIG